MGRLKRDEVVRAYTFRLPEQLMERVKEIADAERRPFSRQVEIFIEDAVAIRDKPTKGGKR